MSTNKKEPPGGKKKGAKFTDPILKKEEVEEAELAGLRVDIEDEEKKKEGVEWANEELEKAVRQMEYNVIQLESGSVFLFFIYLLLLIIIIGNLEADDSEIKHKYDNQRQLNIQLTEQKRWLEHELEQIKLKIQVI